MSEVRYLKDGDLTYREFDALAARPAPRESWALLDRLHGPRADRAPSAVGATRPGAAGGLTLGRYAAPSIDARNMPLAEVFARLARAAG